MWNDKENITKFCKSKFRGVGGMRCKGRLVHLLLNLIFLVLKKQFSYRSALNKVQGQTSHISSLWNNSSPNQKKIGSIWHDLSPAALNERQPHKETGKEPATFVPGHRRWFHWHYYHDPITPRGLLSYRQGLTLTESWSGSNDVQHRNIIWPSTDRNFNIYPTSEGKIRKTTNLVNIILLPCLFLKNIIMSVSSYTYPVVCSPVRCTECLYNSGRSLMTNDY